MTLDPGRTTRQIPPHRGDDHAQRIRAILDRIRTGGGGEGGSTPEAQR